MCKLCETKPVYEFTNKRKVCKSCFVRYFQKKFLTTIRKFGMIKNGNIVGYKKLSNFRDIVLEDLLFMFAEKGRVEIVQMFSKKKIDKIAMSSTIDSESDKIIHILIEDNIKKLEEVKPIDKKIIKPLYLFLDKEILLYAEIKNLKFKKEKIARDKISNFIDELEKKHPEIKRAIINSYLELN